jgi:uncharacterized cupredoxin-like copper-binding protein
LTLILRRGSMIRKRHTLFALVATLAIATVACSSSSSTSAGSTSSSASDGSAGASVTATLKDFAVSIAPSEVAAGEVTFEITNEGPSTHEFVVLQTDTAPGDLTVENGLVPEDGITVVGEVEDIAASTTANLTLTLEAGQYVIICNIEGHYEQGMSTGLTAT